MHKNHAEQAGCLECYAEVLKEKVEGKNGRIAIILLSALSLSVGLIFRFVLKQHSQAVILFLAAAGISGYTIAKDGFSSLLRKRVSMDLLMTVAAVGAFLIGHGEEGAVVIFLFYLAEFLEDHAAEGAKRSIHSLMRLAPEIAVVKREGREDKVHVHSVDVGDTLLVRPGEKIPLDGIIEKGVSSVNQAPITGESMPVSRRAGDEVYAGTINNEGFLEIKVARRSDETILSKIVKLVEEAQERRSPTEKFIDKFSKYYTPSVILLAIGVAVVPTLLFGVSSNEWLYKALVLLVVSCPCALAISTPVAMVSAITNAARNGVLIKGSNYVEEISKIKVFAFDKTGTLTEGTLGVTDVISFGATENDVIARAASLEALSEHPIAKAIVEKAKMVGVKLRDVDRFRAVAGKGVTGEIDGEVHYVGSERMFMEWSIGFPEEQVKKLQDEGKTVVLVGNERESIGMVAVMDEVRNSTTKSIDELKRSGIRTEMITGDNERTARAVARKIGIDEYHAGLLPGDKVSIIGEHLAKDYGHVAMVGDGVNDAPALASASVGIAMGAIGSDISLETADIALMQDDLSKLPYLVELSKKTLRIVKENVFASILIKGSFAILVFPGLVTLWLAVAVGDMGLSLAVILNAMRLSLMKPRNGVGEDELQ